MRKNKFIKLIEHILVALPILMIVATTCYTIFNSNAMNSYYGDTINEETAQQVNVSAMEYDSVYAISTSAYITPQDVGSQTRVLVEDFYLEGYEDNASVKRLEIFYYPSTNSTSFITFLRAEDNTLLKELNWTRSTYTIRFTFKGFYGVTSPDALVTIQSNLYLITYNRYSYLNNAFEYSMNEFNNLGFNKINFTGFFEDIFFEGQPNVYLSFVNCYLNYMLLIECAFVLPLVLYWFIHVGESILYRFEKGEW